MTRAHGQVVMMRNCLIQESCPLVLDPGNCIKHVDLIIILNRNKSVLLKMTVCHLKVLWWKHGVVSVYYCGAAIIRIGLKSI